MVDFFIFNVLWFIMNLFLIIWVVVEIFLYVLKFWFGFVWVWKLINVGGGCIILQFLVCMVVDIRDLDCL